MIQHSKSHPLVSIIIVNYNGHHLLEGCLSALRELEYPRSKIEIILVDNNSTDDSIQFVSRHFPEVKIVQNPENLGFTGGNIAGYKASTGEYIVLLNSDVTVDKNWLKALVSAAANPKVGIVTSRLRFAFPFIELTIESAAVPRSKVFRTIDHSPIGVLIEEVNCETATLTQLVHYKEGFYDRKEGEISTRRTVGNAKVLLPFNPDQATNTYTLTLHGLESPEPASIPVNVLINGHKKHSASLSSHEATQLHLSVTRSEVQNSYKWLIQNAGNIVLSTGYSKDRGSVVVLRNNEQREFYEEESVYFDHPAKLLSACGASCLIKREVIEKIDFLDGHYFMYYEDVEFSLRAWRAGWEIAYAPDSVGYHLHRATTGNEESAFFLNLVERNHMALVLTHFPLSTIVKQSILFGVRCAVTLLKCVVFQFSENEVRAEIWRKKWEGRITAVKWLLRSCWRLLKTHHRMNKLWPIDQSVFQKALY